MADPLATAFVRLRPSLGDEDRAVLEELGRNARALADGIDSFLNNFAREPEQRDSRIVFGTFESHHLGEGDQ